MPPANNGGRKRTRPKRAGAGTRIGIVSDGERKTLTSRSGRSPFHKQQTTALLNLFQQKMKEALKEPGAGAVGAAVVDIYATAIPILNGPFPPNPRLSDARVSVGKRFRQSFDDLAFLAALAQDGDPWAKQLFADIDPGTRNLVMDTLDREAHIPSDAAEALRLVNDELNCRVAKRLGAPEETVRELEARRLPEHEKWLPRVRRQEWGSEDAVIQAMKAKGILPEDPQTLDWSAASRALRSRPVR